MTDAQRLARLVEIADELDVITTRSVALYAERLRLWREGREAGMTLPELAEPSRVTHKTVSALTIKEP